MPPPSGTHEGNCNNHNLGEFDWSAQDLASNSAWWSYALLFQRHPKSTKPFWACKLSAELHDWQEAEVCQSSRFARHNRSIRRAGILRLMQHGNHLRCKTWKWQSLRSYHKRRPIVTFLLCLWHFANQGEINVKHQALFPFSWCLEVCEAACLDSPFNPHLRQILQRQSFSSIAKAAKRVNLNSARLHIVILCQGHSLIQLLDEFATKACSSFWRALVSWLAVEPRDWGWKHHNMTSDALIRVITTLDLHYTSLTMSLSCHFVAPENFSWASLS